MLAWLQSDQTKATAKAKLNEGLTYVEQGARDIVNKQRAEISSTNCRTAKELLEALEGQDHGCIRVDDFLAIRYTQAGETRAYVLKLTIPELAVVLANSAILDQPARVMENIALLLYGDNGETQALEA